MLNTQKPQPTVRIVNNVEKKKDKSFLETLLVGISTAIGLLCVDIEATCIGLKIMEELGGKGK
jgi:hypothetical protein